MMRQKGIRQIIAKQQIINRYIINNMKYNNSGTTSPAENPHETHFQTSFVFQSDTPYICLTELQIERDLFYGENLHCEHSTTINSLILDSELAIVDKSNTKRDLLAQLAIRPLQAHDSVHLSFSVLHFDLPKLALAPIPYTKYLNINDFIIGRAGWGRPHQNYKIQQNTISKEHCSIVHLKSSNQRITTLHQMLKKAFTAMTAPSSIFKRVSNELWQNIFEYISPKKQYAIVDLGSRNGTWVCQEQQTFLKARQNFAYQFNNETYSIYVSKIFTSKQTEELPVLKHNENVKRIIEEFSKEVNWCYYEPAKKTIILSNGLSVGSLSKKRDQKIEVIVLKIVYRDRHEFYLIGVGGSSKKKFSIGCHQQIDTSCEQEEQPVLNGRICFQKQEWVIQSESSFKQNSRIWVKIPKDSRYYLSTDKHYKLRLGITNFNLQFHNFP